MFRYWFILAIMVAIGSGGYYVISGSYPVALVNWEPITVRSFNDNKTIAYHYYGKLYDLYKENKETLESEESREEIARAVLDRLVEDRLIWDELKNKLGASELDALIEKKINEALKDKSITEGVELLYGVSLPEFTEETLKPIAAREMLEDRLELENGNFDEWLKGAKEKANITLFLPNFSWDSIKGIITN